MQIDRIAIDILDWIRRIFHRPQGHSKSFQPTVLKRKTSAKGEPFEGVLALVVRDTRRSVRTWVYMPPRKGLKHSAQRDIHLCLDSLEKLAQERNEVGGDVLKIERSKGNTHRITILNASHWCDKNGAFDTEELFSGFFDFRASGSDPHRWAIAALDNLALLLPFRWEDGDFPWELEVKLSRTSAK